MRPLSDSFEILRARVEARAVLPALVVVSAAERGDGTTSVACGLARAFAADGRQTLLVDANPAHAAVAEELGVKALPLIAPGAEELGSRDGEIAGLSLVSVASERAREPQLPSLLRDARAHFGVTVVDAGPLPACTTALYLARCADAVILAVRLGRRSTESDREAARLAGDRLIGVVPTHARGLRASSIPALSSNLQSPLRAIIPLAGRPH